MHSKYLAASQRRARSAALRLLASVALTCAVAAGCDPVLTESPILPQNPAAADVRSDTELRDAEGEGPGTGSMTGTWVLIHENSSCINALGRTEEALSLTAYLLDIVQEGTQTFETWSMCAVVLSPILRLRALVPNATTDLVTFHPVDTGHVSRAGRGGSYVSSTEVHLWGFRTSDPLRDPVPTQARDPRVEDADDDGNPGVTFLIEGGLCERYNIQRSISRYFGQFTTPNQIDGRSSTTTETRVLGASSPICNINVELAPNDPFSRFRLVRVDGEGGSLLLSGVEGQRATCDDVRDQLDRLWTMRDADNDNCSQRPRPTSER